MGSNADQAQGGTGFAVNLGQMRNSRKEPNRTETRGREKTPTELCHLPPVQSHLKFFAGN